jgi:predicted dehydrogenase
VPDKETDVPIEILAPDFSVACIKYKSGVVARLTCSIIAPADHAIKIYGDEGELHIKDCWKNRETVYLNRRRKVLGRSIESPWSTKVPLLGGPELAKKSHGLKKVDFCLGPLEIIASLREGRECRLSARFCLHVNEIVLAIHNALAGGPAVHVTMGSTFDPIDPMPWAR